MLRDALTGHGLDPASFPIKELAEWSVRMAKFQTTFKGGLARAYLHETATTIAWTAAAIATGESSWSAKEIKRSVDRGSPDHVWEMMAAHDPKRFGLDGLEKTQLANATLLRARSAS
ncbi:MAG TPA: hypothetical protein VMU37_03600 [Caulobacteraceae bacterium]|nr:hypothetical protein [Caulobacteraceae bacterium]